MIIQSFGAVAMIISLNEVDDALPAEIRDKRGSIVCVLTVLRKYMRSKRLFFLLQLINALT